MELKSGTNKKEYVRTQILNEKLLPLLVKMSIPTIIGMLIMVIYSLTDTFFVGVLNDKSMTASIGISFSFISIIQAIGFWFGYGSGNIMSKKIGEKDEKEAQVISSVGISFSIFSGFLIAIVSWIFILDLSKFIGANASPSLFKNTVDYLRIIIVAIPFILYSITLYNQLRLCGNVKDAMLGLLLGIFSNMLLDPVFMFVFDFGFVGAGYATFVGQIVSCISLSILVKRNGVWKIEGLNN